MEQNSTAPRVCYLACKLLLQEGSALVMCVVPLALTRGSLCVFLFLLTLASFGASARSCLYYL